MTESIQKTYRIERVGKIFIPWSEQGFEIKDNASLGLPKGFKGHHTEKGLRKFMEKAFNNYKEI